MTDVYVERIEKLVLERYKALLAGEKIRNPHVVYTRGVGTTIVEYDSDLPHEEIVKFLKG